MMPQSIDPPKHASPMTLPASVSVAVIWAVASLVMTIILLAMGRHWWCQCGSLVPWSWQIYSQHNSQHWVDPYSFTHFLHGLVFYAALSPLRQRSYSILGRPVVLTPLICLALALAVEAGWEILENTPWVIDRYRAATISLDYYGDSIANSLSDLFACLLGYLAANRLRWQISLALFVIIEVTLLMTIRDSLLLNVVMLVYPIDAILNWQSGG